MQSVLLSNIMLSVPKLQTPSYIKKIILQDVIIIVINIVIN